MPLGDLHGQAAGTLLRRLGATVLTGAKVTAISLAATEPGRRGARTYSGDTGGGDVRGGADGRERSGFMVRLGGGVAYRDPRSRRRGGVGPRLSGRRRGGRLRGGRLRGGRPQRRQPRCRRQPGRLRKRRQRRRSRGQPGRHHGRRRPRQGRPLPGRPRPGRPRPGRPPAGTAPAGTAPAGTIAGGATGHGSGSERFLAADGVVLAVPPAAGREPASRIGGRPGGYRRRSGGWSGLGESPIVNVHVVYDRPVTRPPVCRRGRFAGPVDLRQDRDLRLRPGPVPRRCRFQPRTSTRASGPSGCARPSCPRSSNCCRRRERQA